MTKLLYKKIYYCLIILSSFILLFSFYAQYGLGLLPCSLCITQRLCVFLILFLLLASLCWMKHARLFSLLQLVCAGSGLFFAVRQLWLHSLPQGSAPACMPGLDILIHYFPWQDVAHALFLGSADCGEITWQLLGLPMAGWSALYFLFMMSSSIYLCWHAFACD